MGWMNMLAVFMLHAGLQQVFGAEKPCFDALFQFGDSLSDTGNAIAAFPAEYTAGQRSPYGSTFFHHPANRYSDGRLMIDHLAQGLGLPLLSPYLQSLGSSYKHGVDFSVVAATVLDMAFLNSLGIPIYHPFNLRRQVDWYTRFKTPVLQQAGNDNDASLSPNAFSRGLHIVGEIGGNDYSFAALSPTFNNASALVPYVVGNITTAIKTLYNNGARKFLIPNIPLEGCIPFFLTIFGATSTQRDQFGCLKQYNDIDVYHNNLLRVQVQDLRNSLRDACIVYADLYGKYIDVLRNPAKYGITNTLSTCCGGGGPYNYNPMLACGTSTVINGTLVNSTTCPDPSKYVYWDEFHFTDRFNQILAEGILSGEYLEPRGPLQCQESI